MIKKLLALKLIFKSNNFALNSFLSNATNDDITEVFEGNYLNLHFKYNFPEPLLDTLSSVDKVKQLFNEVDKIIENSQKHNVKILTIWDEDFPTGLKNDPKCPPIIYFKGTLASGCDKTLGCVGTRKPSKDGVNAVYRLIPHLVHEGFTIVSGLAEGIDYFSHRVCLEKKGITIAVLAHGLDYIYPSINRSLAEQIINNNGLLISEYPVGERPLKNRFIERNRIISSLSKGILVFESGIKSGTMHTVTYAIEQNKPIFCPNIQSEGVQHLISNGHAIPLVKGGDYRKVIEKLGYSTTLPINNNSQDKESDKENKTNQNKNILKHKKIKPSTTMTYSKSILNLLKSSMKQAKVSDLQSLNLQKSSLKKFSVNFDEQFYKKFKDVAHKNNLTVQELLNLFIFIMSKYGSQEDENE